MRNPFYQKKQSMIYQVFFIYIYYCHLLICLFYSLLGDALEQNFVFSSLDNVEKQMLANAMERISVCEGEDVITQGIVIFLYFLPMY